MIGRGSILVTAVAALLAAAVPVSASHGISPDGILDTVEVVAEAPDYDGGLMPEVEVVADGPAMVLDEVESVAEGPRMVLDEVVVVAEGPDRESGRVVRIVMHDMEFTFEHIY